MDVSKVIEHYGDVKATSKALRVSLQAVYQWIEADDIPLLRQAQIERQTGGLFKAPPDVMGRLLRRNGVRP
ncbi:MAG: Cro/CI family transcriptional regulator [Methylocella sp.]